MRACKPRLRRGGWWTLALGVLLLPLPWVPAQGIEPSFTLSFSRDPPHYLEGEAVGIRIDSTVDPSFLRNSGYTIEVQCSRCPDPKFSTPFATQTVFPRDYTPSTPGFRASGEPRFNDTWTVRVVAPAGAAVFSRSFFVWGAELFRYPQNTPQAGQPIFVQSSGWSPSEYVTVTIQKRTAEGGWLTLYQLRSRADREGFFRVQYTYPREEAHALRCPPKPEEFCQTISVGISGDFGRATKPSESFTFLLKPALLQLLPIVEPPEGATYSRTETEVASFRLLYPDGTYYTPQLVGDPNATVSILVENVSNAGRGPVTVVGKIGARFVPELQLWAALWTIPKNLTLSPAGTDRFRMALEPLNDRWGNDFPHHTFNLTRVVPLTFTPRVQKSPSVVERTDLVLYSLNISYRNGEPLSPQDIPSNGILKGCFLPTTDDPGTFPCRNRIPATVRYSNGTWNFTTRFPRSFEPLGGWRLVIDGTDKNSTDRWGNSLPTQVLDPFLLTTASPRVDLVTSVLSEARNETRGFQRGERVLVHARITYPDSTPFNHTSSLHGRVVPLTLSRRNSEGVTISTEVLNLTERDARQGIFEGEFSLPFTSDDAPLGKWSLRLDVADNSTPRNSNSSLFYREVHPATLSLATRQDPPAVVLTGSTALFRFGLLYPDGRPVTTDHVDNRLLVNVYSWEGSRAGTLVAAGLLPSFEGSTSTWEVRWNVPTSVYSGTMIFRPIGTDRYGNVVDPEARSSPFVVQAPTVTRQVLSDVPSQVRRGSLVYVVFDGREGDRGPDGTGAPRILLERLVPPGRWETEIQNVLVGPNPGGDWVGRWETNLQSTLGTYRLTLVGRDIRNSLIRVSSSNFTLLPANVTRDVLQVPPSTVAKGQLYTLVLRTERGDTPTEVTALQEGRKVSSGTVRIFPDRWEASWRPIFSDPLGNYTLLVRGRDVWGNLIRIESPPFSLSPADLQGEVALEPEPRVRRGSTVNFTFVLRYPDGQLYTPLAGDPEILVVNSSGSFLRGNVTFRDTFWLASWVPPADAELGTYRLEVGGVDLAGNRFPLLRSREFRLEPGTYMREFIGSPPLEVRRLRSVEVAILLEAGLRDPSFLLEYGGPVASPTDVFLPSRTYSPRASLEGDLDPSTGRLVLRWVPSRTEVLGAYKISFHAMDRYGNELVARTQPFVLSPAVATGSFVGIPPVVRPGEHVVGVFRYTYFDGTVLTPDLGTPAVALLYNGRVTNQRFEPRFLPDSQSWRIEWDVPRRLPPGLYGIVLGGADRDGNELSSLRAPENVIREDALGAFASLIPGPPLPLLLILLSLTALLGASRIPRSTREPSRRHLPPRMFGKNPRGRR